MALPDKIDSFHRDISMLTGLGSALGLLGMSSYMMSYEYQDFDRVHLQGQDRMEQTYFYRRKVSWVIMAVAGLLYVTGIVLLTLGISLYPNEREEVATNIPGQITQLRSAAAQPTLNEPAILAGISAAMIVGGISYGAYTFNHTESWGWIGSAVYSAGWLGQAFAAATNNKSLESLVPNRLAWTLPGASVIIAGTMVFPWQLQHNYISGPAWPLTALGYMAFTIGTSYLTAAPTL